MPKGSRFIKKLQQFSTLILACATVILAFATVILAISSLVTAKDISKAIKYYSYERILGGLWDEYRWDRTIFMLYGTSDEITSDEKAVLENDLATAHDELWTAENVLLNLRRLPSANSDNVTHALDKFTSDWAKFTEKSSQNRDAE